MFTTTLTRRATLGAGLLFLAGCSRERPLRVGSKNPTEQAILGEVLAQHLERRLGQTVERRPELGGTVMAHQALMTGQVDLYPEYTGTALTSVLKLPPESRAEVVLERVRSEYRSRFRLQWLEPLGFSSDVAMVVRGADAREHALETLSDAARLSSGWVLGVDQEFLTRTDGLPALMKVYEIRLTAAPRTLTPNLLYQALQKKQVSMAAVNSTDGLLVARDLKVLRDDKGAFSPCQAAVVVRSEALEAHRGLREALTALSGKLSQETMRKLNYEVDGNHRRPADVAREFLKKPGTDGTFPGSGPRR
ncbi:MAG: glycine betaine ABC transporter substrate-binding protein [Acidobacteriota bacterium]